MLRKYLPLWKPHVITRQIVPNASRKTFRSLLLISGGMLLLSQFKNIHNQKIGIKSQSPLFIDPSHYIEPKFTKKTITLSERIKRMIRMFQLFVIFLPSIILFPLWFFKRTEEFWLDVFVWSVQQAGVVWIKCFQYLSHRRDIIGEKMANKFLHLREKSPSHTYSQTQTIFLKEYGQNISDMFDQFDKDPIGTGSVGQVYKAVLNGQKVAVKVRHPRVQKNIERDIDMIFLVSRILSKISSFFQAPITNESLKKVLINQLDFNVEAQNLIRFSQQFKGDPNISFPQPISSRQSILIEEFIQGHTISMFQQKLTPFNKEIARVGAKAFFQMLMIHDFIHADLHAGNIIVNIVDMKLSPLEWIVDRLYIIRRWFESQYIKYLEPNPIIKQLYLESKQQQDEVRQIQRKYQKSIKINLIDVGMVLAMGPEDKQSFVKFVLSVVGKKPQLCAEMIYNLSMYKGKKISGLPSSPYLSQYKDKLYKLFDKLTQMKIKDLEGLVLLKGMLDVIREYKMSLQGQFATLLTNMLIIEQIGKDINPSINILKCTVPYFKNRVLEI